MATERLRVFKGSTEINIAGCVLTKTEDHVVDSAVVSMEADSGVGIGNTLDFRKADGSTTIFTARVDSKKRDLLWMLDCKTNGFELNNIRIFKVYDNQAPEDIVEDIVDNFTTNLTFASTETSGVTITKYVAKGYLIDIIKDMIYALQWQLRIDSSDNVYFEPQGNVDNGLTLTNGNNFQILEWEEDNVDMVNHVRVVGGLVNVQGAEESFNGDASTKEFTLTNKPVGDVNVTVGGTRQDPGVDGSGDYEVDEESKKIVFGTAPPVGVNNVVVNYTYQIRVVVDDQDDDSISTYGERFKEFQAPYVSSFNDARKLALGLLTSRSTPLLMPRGFRPYLDWSLDVGELVTVTDPVRNLTAERIIKKLEYNTQLNQTKIWFARREYDFGDLQDEIKERIKKLERRTTDDEVTAEARTAKHNMDIELTEVTTAKWACPVDSFILGHQTLGRVRADLNVEADCSDNNHNGAWGGSGIGGAQYVTAGYRLSAGNFNGTDNVITVTDHADLDLNSDFTIVVSVRVETLPGAVRYLVQKWDGTDGWAVRINASNQVELIYSNGGSDSTLAASTALTAKSFQHVAFVKNGTALTVYVNGSSDNTGTGDAAAGTNTENVLVGQYSTIYFSGMIDEVMLYSDNLTAAQVLDLYNKEINLTNQKLWLSMDNPRLGDRTGRKHTIATDAFLETFDTEDFKGSPTTANWDTSNKKLRMHTSSSHSMVYNTTTASLAYGCGGRSFATVTLTASETKWGSDQILYFVSTDGTTWHAVTLGVAFTLPTIDNVLYWKVNFIGSGGTETFIDELQMAYTLA